MLISYSRPTITYVDLVGSGASFLTSSARLTNGRPSSATRIQWLSGAQTTSSHLDLRAFWANGAATTPGPPAFRLAGLCGLTLPVGTKIVCSLIYDVAFGYKESTTRVVERSDGTRHAWFTFPADTEPYSYGARFQIFNDVYGLALIAADSDFEIGELWIGRGSEFRIKPTYTSAVSDLSKLQTSIGGQPFPIRRRAARESMIDVTPAPYSAAFGVDLSTAIFVPSIDNVRERLLGYQPIVVVPIAAAPFSGVSTLDADYVNRHAEFGLCKSVGPIVGEAPRFTFSAAFSAPPAVLP